LNNYEPQRSYVCYTNMFLCVYTHLLAKAYYLLKSATIITSKLFSINTIVRYCISIFSYRSSHSHLIDGMMQNQQQLMNCLQFYENDGLLFQLQEHIDLDYMLLTTVPFVPSMKCHININQKRSKDNYYQPHKHQYPLFALVDWL
jgi:hypothetical protein